MANEVGLTAVFSGDASGIASAANSAVKSLNTVNAAAAKTGQALAKNIPKGSNQAAAAMTDLTRVVSDAPFGFVAIQNNLQPLMDSFRRLKVETGSSIGAFKALGTSLAGPAGIGLAIAAVSFIWLKYGKDIKAALGIQEDAKEKIKSLKKQLDEYVESLGAVDRARVHGAQNAQDELVKLQFLYQATQNINLSLKDRNRAIDELQSKYPTYFGNLSNEAILAGGAEKAYQRLTNSIIAAAKARAAQDEIVEAQKQILTFERQYADALSEEYKAQLKLNAATKKADRTDDVADVEELSGRIAFAKLAQDDYNKAAQKTADIAKQIFDLQDKSRDLTKEVTTIVEDQGIDALLGTKAKVPKIKEKKVKVGRLVFDFEKIDLSKDVPVIFPAPDRIKEFLEGMKWQIERGEDKTFGDLDNADQLKQRVLNKYRDIFTSVGQSLPETIKVGNIEVPLNLVTNIGIIDAQLKMEADRIKGLINGLNDQVTDFIRNTQVEIAASVGESIGVALAGGDVKGIFANLYMTLGTAMQSLGKSLIATAIGLKAIKEAFKTLNPVVAAAAGVALIALGSALKSSIAKAAPFAAGGLVYGPTLGLVGEGAGTSRNNPEIIAPLDKLESMLGGGSQIVIVNGKIKGNDILLSNARQSKRNRRGG